MARTLLQLRSLLAENTAYDLDNSASIDGVSVTDTELTAQLNTAARWISLQLFQYDPAVTFTTTTSQTYNLRTAFSRKMVEIHKVIINAYPLPAPDGKPGMWTQAVIDERFPSWRTDPSNNSLIAAWQVGDTLYVYPTPTGAISNSYVSGQYMCANLTVTSDDSNYYDLPEEVHEAIAYTAAVFAAVPSASDDEALQRLSTYDARAAKWISEVGVRNRRQLSSRGREAGMYRNNYIWL